MTKRDGNFEWYLAYQDEKKHVFLLIGMVAFLAFLTLFCTTSMENGKANFLEILIFTMEGGEESDFN